MSYFPQTSPSHTMFAHRAWCTFLLLVASFTGMYAESYTLEFNKSHSMAGVATSHLPTAVFSQGYDYVSKVTTAINASYDNNIGVWIRANGTLTLSLSGIGKVHARDIVVRAKHTGASSQLSINGITTTISANVLVDSTFTINDNISTIEMYTTNSIIVESITVNFDAVHVTTNAAGYATFAPAWDVALPEDESMTYYVTSQNASTVTTSNLREALNDGDAIAAGTGVIVKTGAPSTKVVFPVVANAQTVHNKATLGNLLTGVLTDTAYPSNDHYYLFGNGSEGIGFYQWQSDALAAGKAYLDVSQLPSAPLFIRFAEEGESSENNEDIVTDIEDTFLPADQPCYDLLGRPVSAGYKGIVISNGKKYIRM